MRKTIFTLVLALTALTAAAQQRYLLRFNPVLNQVLHYRTQINMTIDVPQVGPMQMQTTIEQDQEAQNMSDRNYIVSTTFTAIDGVMTPTAGTGSSAKGQSINLRDMEPIKALINKPFMMRYNDLRKPEGPLMAETKAMGIDPSMQKMLNSATLPAAFPERPVAVGENWTATMEVQGLASEITFRLVEVTPDAYVVTYDGLMRGTVTETQPGMAVNIDGNISGRTYYSRTTGWEIPGQNNAKITMSMSVPGVMEGMRMQMEVQQ